MDIYLKIGVMIVNLALVCYTSFFILEQKNKMLTQRVLLFLSLGIFFDVIATSCMIAGSKNSMFSLHGILGYSSLLGMLIDTILIWKFKMKNGFNVELPQILHLFSRYAYIWWIVAYITGVLLVMLK